VRRRQRLHRRRRRRRRCRAVCGLPNNEMWIFIAFVYIFARKCVKIITKK